MFFVPVFFASPVRLLPIVVIAMLAIIGRRRADWLRRPRWPLAITTAGVCLFIAAADPRLPNANATQSLPQTELLVVVDSSASMNVRDLDGRSRKDVAGELVTSLRRRLPAQPIGVLRVGDTTALAQPVTREPAPIALTPTGPGTNLAAGIEDAADLLLATSDRLGHILILSDGETHGEALATPARNVTLSAVVLGTTAGGPVPTPDGSPLIYEDQPVTSRATAAPFTAADIAVLSRPDANPAAALDHFVDDLLAAESTAARLQSSTPLYPLFAVLAAAALVVDLMPGRRLANAAVAAACLLLSGQAATAPGLLREGIDAAAAEDWTTAAARFAAAERSSTYADIAAFNRGYAETRAGDFTAAIDAYRRALAVRPHWPEARRNLQLTYRLSQQPPRQNDNPPEDNEPPEDNQTPSDDPSNSDPSNSDPSTPPPTNRPNTPGDSTTGTGPPSESGNAPANPARTTKPW